VSIEGQSYNFHRTSNWILTVTDQNTSPRRKPVPDPSRRGEGDRRRSSRTDEAQFRRGPNGLRIPVRPRPGPDREGSKDGRRRNSDSSAIEKDHERAERERRRKEREAKLRDASRDSRSSDNIPRGSRKSKRNVHVDVVDKLDVTGLYGVGGSKLLLFAFSISTPNDVI
jgi:hypothetical protein